MRLTFRSKFIFINIALVLLTMLVLSVVVIQGLIHYNIDMVQKRLSQFSNEATLYIQQVIKSEENAEESNFENIFAQKSVSIGENLSNAIYTRVLLHDSNGKYLADSANVEVYEEDISEQIEEALALDSGKSLALYRRGNNISRVYSSTPIYVDDTNVGTITFIYSLEIMDTIVSQAVTLFVTTSLISIFILFLLSNYLASSILKPIQTLVSFTKRVSKGQYSELIEYHVNDEIGELSKNFNKMILNISDKITEIKDEKQKLSAIISSIDDGIVAVDFNDDILLINEKAKEILDLEEQTHEIENLEKIPFLREMSKEILSGKREYIKEIDFNEKHLYLYVALINSNNTDLGVLMVLRDTSQLKALEKEQRKFISSVSHELRTPLTTIIGYTDLLQRRGTENVEILNKSLYNINNEGRRLLRLVDDLLSLSKIEQTQFQLVLTSVDINELLEDVIGQMKIKAQRYNIAIDYNSSELPTARGDYDRLKQVFINIIDNAIKYTNSGDIINITASHYDDYVEISIRDYGPGIPEESLDHIFDAFYRVDEDRSRDIGGTGLGLSIVKNILDKHGSEINIESQEGEGTMFTVRILKEK